MKGKHIQIFGLAVTVLYGLFVAWIYWAAPKNVGEVSTKARETIEQATNEAKAATGTYQVDSAKFQQGLNAFRAENFVLARDQFEQADPKGIDPATQYYIAYSFYRQGWGRFTNDDVLFEKGLEQVDKVIALDREYKADDPNLNLKYPVELKQELEEGLRITADDFNPLRLTRERQ
ncbi:MAG: hypothetical protein DWQ47_15000 [Acidobacteria bacterium]|nr:MAG: hypothetical protein DWQ32_02400 [Acidobacteriota bacterium]REK02627.1 MAG: hypothetical protein DWQ38_09735 [Acidobacteriota bacterium]REK13569.1 MAG: hypothetical protein DWQ43_08090 [Acidobacteriota bacterium]REK41563.1 MAG: hypothetical protein DWQ47_15000 [Acidobacteriota bacterium]